MKLVFEFVYVKFSVKAETYQVFETARSARVLRYIIMRTDNKTIYIEIGFFKTFVGDAESGSLGSSRYLLFTI